MRFCSLANVHFSPEPTTSVISHFDFEGRPTSAERAFKTVVVKFNQYGDCVGVHATVNLQDRASTGRGNY